MTCKEFKENIADLFDADIENNILEQHLSDCPDCKKYYKEYEETIGLITPAYAPSMTDSIAEKAKKQAQAHKNKKLDFWKKPAAAVAVFLLGVGFGLSNFLSSDAAASNASKLIDQSLMNIRNVGDFSMVVRVRTLPAENFAYISPQESFVMHHLRVAHVSGELKWRLEKENGRTLVCDGKKQYLWFNSYSQGGIYKASENVSEVFSPLIRPDLLFEYEKKVVENSSSDSYSVQNTDSTVILTVSAVLKEELPPFISSNTSIYNSNNRREYVFDKETRLLKELRYWMLVDNKEILVLESRQITYNSHFDLATLIDIPIREHDWLEEGKYSISTERLAFLQKETPEDAVKRIFEAISANNTENAKEALLSYDMGGLFKTWGGCKIKSIGDPLQPATYGGVYVQVEITCPGNKTEKLTLALRNDNPQKIWILDGGI